MGPSIHQSALTERAHAFLEPVLKPGSVAVDATAGNGHDTVFLARQVGDTGHVFAFDIQKAAIEATRKRLADAGLLERVTLLEQSHARLETAMTLPENKLLDAVMFNLGYLPGGRSRIATQGESTRVALQAALERLRKTGRMTVLVYPGHPEGRSEAVVVDRWVQTLPAGISVDCDRGHKPSQTTPYLIKIQCS